MTAVDPAIAAPAAGSRRAAPWLVGLATVVVAAILQGLTAVPGLGTASGTVFGLELAASVALLVAEAVLLAWAAHAIAVRGPLGRPGGALVVWSAVLVLLATVVAVVVPYAVPLVLALAGCVLVAAAAGERNALRGLRVFVRTPWRAIAATVVSVLVLALSWVVALVAGLFLTGALGGAVMWAWTGLVVLLLLVWWARIHARSAPVPAPDDV